MSPDKSHFSQHRLQVFSLFFCDLSPTPVLTPDGLSLLFSQSDSTRFNPHWRRRYLRLAMRRHRSIAKVAMGRRMAIRLYWMWRNGCEYSPSFEFGSYVGQLGTRHGGK